MPIITKKTDTADSFNNLQSKSFSYIEFLGNVDRSGEVPVSTHNGGYPITITLPTDGTESTLFTETNITKDVEVYPTDSGGNPYFKRGNRGLRLCMLPHGQTRTVRVDAVVSCAKDTAGDLLIDAHLTLDENEVSGKVIVDLPRGSQDLQNGSYIPVHIWGVIDMTSGTSTTTANSVVGINVRKNGTNPNANMNVQSIKLSAYIIS